MTTPQTHKKLRCGGCGQMLVAVYPDGTVVVVDNRRRANGSRRLSWIDSTNITLPDAKLAADVSCDKCVITYPAGRVLGEASLAHRQGQASRKLL